jgi:fructose-specific phosphotransferase system component IIB
MLFRPTLVSLLCSSLLALSPVSAWSLPSQDGYDCVKVGKSGYRCIKGPLTGQTFTSQKAMILAMTKGAGTQNGAVAERVLQVKTDNASTKKAKIDKASSKKVKADKASPKKSKKSAKRS